METGAKVKFITIPEIDKQIFKKIWNEPRSVFQFLNENEYNKQVDKLLILGAITNALHSAARKDLGDDMSLVMIILYCGIGGGLIGWMLYYFYAYLLNLMGKWLNAQDNYKALLRILAYALIPSIFGLGIFIILMLLFGNSIFKSEFNPLLEDGYIMALIYYLLSLMYSFLVFGTLLLIVIGVSIVQKLSMVKAIINCLLPLVILAIPSLVLNLLVYFLY